MTEARTCKECGETKPFVKGMWLTFQGKPRGLRCLACATRKSEAWAEKSRATKVREESPNEMSSRKMDGRRAGWRLSIGSPAPKERTCKDCGQTKPYAKNTWVTIKDKPVGWRCLDCATKKNNEWAAENREHAARKALDWRNNNLERARTREAAWYRENPEVGILKAHIRRARIREVGGKLSRGITNILFVRQQGKCAACRATLSLEKGLGKAHLDHIMPLVLGGQNSDDNVQLLCPMCNQRKGSKHPDLWSPVAPARQEDDDAIANDQK